jgi:hypothetical protein
MDYSLPYIPPPDYTVRIKPTNVSKNDRGKPHHYVPSIKHGKIHSSSNYEDDEPSVDIRSKSEVQAKVLKMLRHQGVPVLPGVNSRQRIDDTNGFVAHKPYVPQPTQDFGQINHLDRSSSGSSERSISRHNSPIISGRAFQPLNRVNEIEIQEEPEEDANFVLPGGNTFDSSERIRYNRLTPSPVLPRLQRLNYGGEYLPRIAIARRSWQGQSPDQLNIRSGEELTVTEVRNYWCRCVNASKHDGWVPMDYLSL